MNLKTLAVGLFLLFPSIRSQAQESSLPKINKNALVAAVGMFQYSLSYERRLVELNKGSLNAKAGYGKINAPDYYGSNWLAAIGYLHGRNAHHLDADFGCRFFTANDRGFSELALAAHLGYRFQRPAGLLVVKAGIGSPEGIYLGIGLAF